MTTTTPPPTELTCEPATTIAPDMPMLSETDRSRLHTFIHTGHASSSRNSIQLSKPNWTEYWLFTTQLHNDALTKILITEEANRPTRFAHAADDSTTVSLEVWLFVVAPPASTSPESAVCASSRHRTSAKR